jgi:hypothetical protein
VRVRFVPTHFVAVSLSVAALAAGGCVRERTLPGGTGLAAGAYFLGCSSPAFAEVSDATAYPIGCAGAAQSYYQSLSQELAYLAGTLWTDVNGNGRLDAGHTGLLTRVPSTEFARQAVITVAAGALFNVQLLNVDGSHGVHNPRYFRTLLAATILAVQQHYGLTAPPAAAALVAREAARLGVKIAAH